MERLDGFKIPTVERVPIFISNSPSPVTTSTCLSGRERANPKPIAVAPPIAPAIVKMLSPSLVKCAMSFEAPASPHTISRSSGLPINSGTAYFRSRPLSLSITRSPQIITKRVSRRLTFASVKPRLPGLIYMPC